MPTEFESNNNRKPQNLADLSDDAIWDLLSVYADGEATPEQAAIVEALIASDPLYAQDLQFMRRTSESVQMLTELEPPVALREAIFAATTRRQPVAARLLAFWGDLRQTFAPRARLTLSLGGLAAAALVGILFFRHTPGAQSPNDGPLKLPNRIKIMGNLAQVPNTPEVNPPTETPPPVDPGLTKILAFPPKVEIPPDLGHEPSTAPPATLAAAKPGPNPVEIHPKQPPKTTNPPKLIFPSDNNPSGPSLASNNVNPGRESEIRHMEMHPNLSDPVPSEALATTTPGDSDKTGTGGNTSGPGGDGPPPPPQPTRPEVKIRVATLPPEAYQFLTNAQMKQKRDAFTLGYNRDTVKSIQRGELTVSLIKGSL
ncbi:MAG TPA: hypothetical protein VKU00_29210 [Chthonomonadaceae bacterium]|nr:hypothetical protein [Chthonomonadaceae bacterium]